MERENSNTTIQLNLNMNTNYYLSLIFVTFIIFGCKQNSVSDQTISRIEIPGLYATGDNSSSLLILSDSSFLLSHIEGMTMYKEVGELRLDSGNAVLKRSVDISDLVKVTLDTMKSDTLKLQIQFEDENMAGKGIEMVLFDSLLYTAVNNQFIIDKKQIYNSLPFPNAWTNFDNEFLYNILIKSGDYYFVFFESESTNQVALTLPSEDVLEGLNRPIDFMRLAIFDDKLSTIKNGHPAINFDELFKQY